MNANSALGAWVADIEKATLTNENFRTVLFTGGHTQLTVMRIKPGEEIGREVHGGLDQFLRVEEGRARLELGPDENTISEVHELADDWAAVIPAGVWHNVVNAGDSDLRVYSLYSPPEHAAGTVHPTKADADADEHAH